MTDTFLPKTGGGEIHVLELSRALREMENEVQICTGCNGADLIDGFKITRLPNLSNGNFKSVLHSFLYQNSLYSFVRSVDVLHCHYSYLFAALGVFWGKILNKPIIVTLHGLGTLDSSVHNSPLRKFYRQFSLRNANKIIATSDEMKSIACRYTSPDKVTVIPNGVDTTKFSNNSSCNLQKPNIIVLAMRRLVPKNGVQYLIDAAPKIIENIPNIKLVIAGEGRINEYLRERVKLLHIEKYIDFVGMIPHEKTREYYDLADVVVFPSSAESTSLACLEAMSMKKAVVASELEPYKQLLGNNQRGLLVNLFDRTTSDYDAPLILSPQKIEQLADRVIQLAHDDVLRKNFGLAAREFVLKKYDWKIIAQDVLNVYLSKN